MASGGSFDEDDFYKRVLTISQKRFVSDADPVALLDVFLQKEFIDHDLYRDISELALTSQKNKQIIETVRTKAKDGYRRFKECLRESGQGHLAEHLERNEKKIKQTTRKKTTQTTGKVSDEDLTKIANAIGKNWEMLAPALGLIDTEVDHLKMNYDTVQLCIYQMLMTWKKRSRETSTLPNLLSKIQSIPSVNVNMDYIYDNVSGAVMADSYQRSKPTRVMPQDVKGDLRLEPVENSVSTKSGSNDGEDKYKQVEEQTSSSNIVDGVSPVKERPEQQPQEESPDASTVNRSEEVIIAEDQIDANATSPPEFSTSTAEITYENLNLSYKPEYDSMEKRPIQVTQNEKIDGVISVLSSLKSSDSQTSMYKEKDKGRGENKDFRLSTNIEVEMPAGSNDDSLSAAREIRLKEEFRPPRHKPHRKCTHDGRLLICKEKVFQDIKGYCNTNKPIEGGFGCVYISEGKIPGLDIKVALKEINCYGKNKHYEHSATNEKLASRVMHFAIVPLLAMGYDTDKRIYWFLSPCLDRGDLFTLIEKDTSRITKAAIADVELNRQRRLKILYHISAAIDFLHTEIENFRGVIIHLDVKTRNVVLDRFYNARLTDFGVARETAEKETSVDTSPTAIPLTEGYFNPPNFVKLEKHYDYFNIGVVIRELLTGKHPSFKYLEDSKEEYLWDLNEDEMEFNVQEDIWNDQEKLCQSAEILLTLSMQCIDSAKQSEVRKDGKLTSEYILKEMQKVIRQHCYGCTWERLPANEQNFDNDNCEMCMVNPSVDKDLLSHGNNCKCPLKVCVSCMRNSYLNPMRCHSCLQEIDPLIGSKYGAVLLAGRYDNDMNFSNSCANDVADMRKVIISKCPLVVGIREKHVRTVTPRDSTSPDDCISQLQSAFSDLKESGVKTIFFYYSGHYSKADGFITQKKKVDTGVPSNEQEYKCEHLSLSNFKDMLRSFLVENNGKTADKKDKNFIITLDCCEAPIIRLNDSESHDDNISQLNACRPNQAAIQEPDGSGSLFKKIFIQALIMKSTKDNCFLERDGKQCSICPFKGDDFITIGSLNTYIGRHMKEYQKLLCTEPQMPVQYSSSDVKIAYLVDTTSELSFTMKCGGIQKECKIDCHFYNNTSQLKETLFKEFMNKMLDKEKEKDSQLQLKVNTYKDILQIVAKTGPKDKDKHKLKLNNLAQVMSAWNGKRELYVEMREISTIEDGMVGVFNDDTEKFLSFLDKCKYEKQEEPDHTTYKIDLAVFLKVKDDSLKQLQVGILAYRKKEKSAELHIIRPCMTDEKGLRKMRDDFVCFKIEKVKTLETADTESK